MRSGSGWVAVAPVDAAEQGGSNGGGGNMVVAVLAELQWFENEAEKIDKNGKSVMLRHTMARGVTTSGSG
jgi:hypothetical protein